MQITIPDDWDGLSFCKWAVMWPDSPKWKAILHGLVESPNQGRFWDFSTGNFLSLRSSFRPAYDYNFELKECIMACGDTFLQEIAQSLQKIADKACCGGGEIDISFNPKIQINLPDGTQAQIWGSVEPMQAPPQGEFPEGYSNRQEYDSRRCSVATALVNGWIFTFKFLLLHADVNLTLGILIAILGGVPGLLTIPVAVLPAIVGWLIILAIYKQVLLSALNDIETQKQNLICEIYNSPSSQDVAQTIADAASEAIDLLPIPTFAKVVAKLLATSILSVDAINDLFEFVALSIYPDADCTSCTGCPEFFVQWGTRQEMIFNSVPHPTWPHVLIVYLDYNPTSGYCNSPTLVEFSQIGFIPAENTSGDACQIYNQAGSGIYVSSVFPQGQQFCIGAFAFYGEQPFSVSLSLLSGC